MAQMNFPTKLDDEDEDDQTPYASVASRDPLPDPQSAPPPSPPTAGVNPAIAAAILKRAGGQTASMPSGPYASDPLMKKFEMDQAELDKYRQAKVQSDNITNMGQAFSQLAQGVNAPKDNTSLYQNIANQGKELLTSKNEDLDRRLKVTNAIEGRKTREDIAANNLAARTSSDQSKSADRALQRDVLNSNKSDAQVNKWTNAMKDDLDPNKARGGNMATNQKRVDNADRVQALLDQVHNNPDPRQMEELAISTQSLLSASGTPGAEQVKALIPKTALGNVNALKEWLTNDPTGTGQQAFVQRMADTVSREKDIASNQVKTAQRQRLSAYSRFKDAAPEEYNQLINAYGLSDDTPKASQVTAQAEKAGAPPPKNKPKTVMQNGHTYTLNESTGEYE